MGFKDHTKSGGRGLNFTPVSLQEMDRNGATGRFPESESLCITSDFESSVLQLYSIATFPVTED